MLKIAIATLAAFASAAALQGAGLFEENSALKAELSERQERMQELHRRIQELSVETETLRTVAALTDGALETPPAAERAGRTELWSCKLDSAKEFAGGAWPRFAESVKDGGDSVLKISCREAGDGKFTIERWLSKEELDKAKGKRVFCSVVCKGEELAGAGAAKFMLMAPAGEKTHWPSAQIGKGSFDWRLLEFSYEVPLNAKGLLLVLGLQGSTGSVYFKNLKVEISDEQRAPLRDQDKAR